MVPTQPEELMYHAFRSPSLRELEREEIERKTKEFLKKKNKIQKIPFGVSGEKDAYSFDERKGYAYKIMDANGTAPKNRGKDKKKALWEYDWRGVVFNTVTILTRINEESRNGAMWSASCTCGHEFKLPSIRMRQKLVRCPRCGDGKKKKA